MTITMDYRKQVNDIAAGVGNDGSSWSDLPVQCHRLIAFEAAIIAFIGEDSRKSDLKEERDRQAVIIQQILDRRDVSETRQVRVPYNA
jgi:hypothetical protein